ncbi:MULTISPECIES: siderophore-interacting protein [Brevibacterium]|uniref:NADPH-dependent ferric siderophore reductase, contains FAD-binding and SIP domains n=1 Tax=Brevibacterium antiquum CNRZ 918 TaxID=1255637 RepID=A0A2H1I5J1_9MICO|nr:MULTISPECIES: siderophore-interacting protein [Brevibacterium]SMX70458.1 NADPH-dependent ferric siderophore reductase, contains FAD-binding and SIP domains [Brevibacterium antiquum CNRZ 918]HCG55142.1 siderophore-interacting protein [Brevibacterium sp.]
MSQAPITAFEATVIGIEDLSPIYRRVTFGGEGLRDFGCSGHPRDLRFKLIIPSAGATKPTLDLLRFLDEQDPDSGMSWYQAWLQLDPDVRGEMRTYTVREWRDAACELVVDMVLHTDDQGHSGPAAAWAQNAEVGHSLHIIGPSRHAEGPTPGIEFAPADADTILLAGDETAVPAIASILESLKGAEVQGKAILEVPTAEDVLELDAPAGFDIQWLPRGNADYGQLLEPAVRDAVRVENRALAEVGAGGPSGRPVELDDVNIDKEILWDVPAALTQAAQGSSSGTERNARPFYAWIAGEAGPVKRLRRYLVQEVGVDRHQIAFMGYWRQGKAEG